MCRKSSFLVQVLLSVVSIWTSSRGELYPCHGETQTRIIYAEPKDTKTVPLCIVASQNISDVAILNNQKVTANEHDSSTKWRWQFKPRDVRTYTVNITVSNVTDSDYGPHTFEIMQSQSDQQKLRYTLVLKAVEQPECPRNLQINGKDPQNVTVSWLPGFDGGSSQWFIVYYKEGNGLWTEYDANVTRSFISLTELKEHTNYTFEIVPRNKIFVNMPCERKSILTGKRSPAPVAIADSTSISTIANKTANTTTTTTNATCECLSKMNILIWFINGGAVSFILLVIAIVTFICICRRLDHEKHNYRPNADYMRCGPISEKDTTYRSHMLL